MPIYEYKCRSCGHQFEKIVRFNEEPNCEACQSADLEKLFTAPGIRTTKSQRRSTAQEQAARNRVRRDQKVAESDFIRKELSEGH